METRALLDRGPHWGLGGARTSNLDWEPELPLLPHEFLVCPGQGLVALTSAAFLGGVCTAGSPLHFALWVGVVPLPETFPGSSPFLWR